MTPLAVAPDVVAAAGADALVAAARAHLDGGRPVEALQLTDLVLAAEPGHAGRRRRGRRRTPIPARGHRELLGGGVAAPGDHQAGRQPMNEVRFDFSGAAVLVTGGTSGIGHGIARGFADAGASVTVTGTRPSADGLRHDLAGLAYHQLVLTDADAVDALAPSLDRLDVLVNNAGATMPGRRRVDRRRASRRRSSSASSARCGWPRPVRRPAGGQRPGGRRQPDLAGVDGGVPQLRRSSPATARPGPGS